jgi:mannose-6-phosphate isomerase-like protein (cupin superfamily)
MAQLSGPVVSESIEKIWGTTQPLIVTPMFEMHRLIIKPEHRCSLHVHRFKHNAFYVIEGQLYIDHIADFKDDEVVVLPSGGWWTIPPGTHHQFRTGPKPCTALEMYYTEPLSEDIVRHNVGGSALETYQRAPQGLPGR